MSGPGVRDSILTHGKTFTEGTAFFWGNVTKIVKDSIICALTVDSGRRAGVGTFKPTKDFAI